MLRWPGGVLPGIMNFDLWFFRKEFSYGNMTSDGESHRAIKTGSMVLAAVLLLICTRPLFAQEATRHSPLDQESLGQILAGNILAGTRRALISTGAAAGLPDAPPAQSAAPSQNPTAPSSPPPSSPALGNGFGVLAFLPPPVTRKRLTPKDKFQIYLHQNYGPQNFILPAVGAGASMLYPPTHYPHDWKDCGGAFGRWYGEQIAASTANRTAQMLTGIAWHEDPRYLPSSSKDFFMRLGHAMAFTLVDKTDGGRNTLALANLAGAAAGGFVGMSFLPPGYNDTTHAEQRALRGLSTIAVRNILTEFRPEYEPTLQKIHIPSILPACWTRKRPPAP